MLQQTRVEAVKGYYVRFLEAFPTVKDLACVPTGITKYREGLHPIPDVDGEYSKKLLDLVDSLNKEFGVDFLLPADEYFVKANRPFKNKEFYGEFEQIENGIGMTSKFISEVEEALEGQTFVLKKPKKSLIISGVSAEQINRKLLKACEEKIVGLTTDVLAVENEFFGSTVTCTGLLTGQDIVKAINAYKEKGNEFDEIVLPANTLKEFEDVFLCGMTLKELKSEIKCKNIRINRTGGSGLVQILSTKK
jgi:NifB/MoaA-like Fe-S oxidoreductase